MCYGIPCPTDQQEESGMGAELPLEIIYQNDLDIDKFAKMLDNKKGYRSLYGT